jgi:hypothetical protein
MTVVCSLCGAELEVPATRGPMPHRDPAWWERADRVLDAHEKAVHW